LTEKNLGWLFLLHILLLSLMKLTIKRQDLKTNHRSILELITRLFPNLPGLLLTKSGNSLVNKTMTMRTLGILGRNKIKNKNLINLSKEKEVGAGLMRWQLTNFIHQIRFFHLIWMINFNLVWLLQTINLTTIKR